MSRIVRASDQTFLVIIDEAITREAVAEVRRLHSWLRLVPIDGLVELHPAYASLLVRFDALRNDAASIERELRVRLDRLADHPAAESRDFEILVRYGGADGPDLLHVAATAGRTPDEIVATHAQADYEVAFVGFSPGFPYLLGLPQSLATPRRASPRRGVPAGSVAIAGPQCGIYPVRSPGGWNIIGRTELVLFDAGWPSPALLAPGDRIRFVPVGYVP